MSLESHLRGAKPVYPAVNLDKVTASIYEKMSEQSDSVDTSSQHRKYRKLQRLSPYIKNITFGGLGLGLACSIAFIVLHHPKDSLTAASHHVDHANVSNLNVTLPFQPIIPQHIIEGFKLDESWVDMTFRNHSSRFDEYVAVYDHGKGQQLNISEEPGDSVGNVLSKVLHLKQNQFPWAQIVRHGGQTYYCTQGTRAYEIATTVCFTKNHVVYILNVPNVSFSELLSVAESMSKRAPIQYVIQTATGRDAMDNISFHALPPTISSNYAMVQTLSEVVKQSSGSSQGISWDYNKTGTSGESFYISEYPLQNKIYLFGYGTPQNTYTWADKTKGIKFVLTGNLQKSEFQDIQKSFKNAR